MVRLVQPENGLETTELENVQERALKFTTDRPEQLAKAPPPMEVTLLPMVTEVRPVQPLKALLPMEVTLLGIVTEVRLVHP